MTEDNLSEFLNERVLATRQVHHIAYPLDLDGPAVGVMLDCPEDAIAAVILPTFVRGTLHLELHFFVDGERTQPTIFLGATREEMVEHIPPNGQFELVLRRPPEPTMLSHSEEDQ